MRPGAQGRPAGRRVQGACCWDPAREEVGSGVPDPGGSPAPCSPTGPPGRATPRIRAGGPGARALEPRPAPSPQPRPARPAARRPLTARLPLNAGRVGDLRRARAAGAHGAPPGPGRCPPPSAWRGSKLVKPGGPPPCAPAKSRRRPEWRVRGRRGRRCLRPRCEVGAGRRRGGARPEPPALGPPAASQPRAPACPQARLGSPPSLCAQNTGPSGGRSQPGGALPRQVGWREGEVSRTPRKGAEWALG